MGLDIYVGSFTRYYAGDWETIMQKYGREEGLNVRIVRAHEPDNAITDPKEIRPAVLGWRTQLAQELGTNITGPLDWDESDTAPYFTDKPTWDCYASLLLWAAYSEHPTLSRPQHSCADLTKDPAFRRSTASDFKTAYSQLLRDVEVWLPHDYSFTFQAPDASGNRLTFGSSVALLAQLEELNRQTWQATGETIAEWRREGAEHKAPLEVGARFAFSIMLDLSRHAVQHRLMMKLDY